MNITRAIKATVAVVALAVTASACDPHCIPDVPIVLPGEPVVTGPVDLCVPLGPHPGFGLPPDCVLP